MIKKYLLLVLILFGISYILSGCATLTTGQNLPTYNIAGISYVPLTSLCEARGISLDYDSFTKTAALNKGAHKINLRAGDNLVLVDTQPYYLKHRVDIYQGTVVVPSSFQEQILDSLFKKSTYTQRAAAVTNTRIKKIIVDAGHGGNDPGAIGRTGLREKNVTLDIAKRLVRMLREDGIEVEMTRSIDKFIPLPSRVNIANRFNADLFVSIHANANPVRSLKGFEVYYMSNKVSDAKRSLSAAQDYRLYLGDACIANPSLDLRALLWNMIYTYNRSESIELARSLCQSINRNLDSRVLGIKGANYQVLRGVKMPAVLIEVGFLSNKDEECYLQNSYFRQRLAESIHEGILAYAREISLSENPN